MVDVWPLTKVSLRTARLIRGLTIKEAAALANISTRRLSRYEMNVCDTPLEDAIKLLDVYNIPFSALDF